MEMKSNQIIKIVYSHQKNNFLCNILCGKKKVSYQVIFIFLAGNIIYFNF